MSWDMVQAAITFTPDATWPTLPTGSTTLSSIDQSFALVYINQLYNGSPTASTMMDNWVAAGNSIRQNVGIRTVPSLERPATPIRASRT